MGRFYSPLRYPGGKSRIFDFVTGLFKENDLIGINYAEPYAGGAGLALKLLIDEYVDTIYINDLDRSIYSFWQTIIEQPQRFCTWLRNVDITVENWKKYKEIQENSYDAEEFELAQSTFFLNRTNVSGILKGGIIGGYEQKGKYKMDARFNKENLIQRIEKISEFRDRIKVSKLDGIKFINKVDQRDKDTFVYIDPPYYEKGSKLYMNYYTEDDHKKLSMKVDKMKKKWLVSYDNKGFILDLYDSKRKLLYKLSQSASNRVGDEILIFSDQLKFRNSIDALNSPVLL